MFNVKNIKVKILSREIVRKKLMIASSSVLVEAAEREFGAYLWSQVLTSVTLDKSHPLPFHHLP